MMRLAGWSLVLAATCFAASETRLADAVMNHDQAAAVALLKQKVDVNAAQADGTTALHWAARWDDVAMADLLIRAGANAKAVNRFGMRPISLACTNGSAAMVELLLKAGEDANAIVTPDGDTALMMAARTGKADAIKVLLDHGAQVNQSNPRGQTPLMW